MMEQDRVALCGPKGKRLPERTAVRAGSVPSEVTLGGQRIAMRRLRARSADGELVLPSFAFAADRDPLDQIQRPARRVERVDEDALLRAIRGQAAGIDEHISPNSSPIAAQAGTAISPAKARICGASGGQR